MAYGVINTSLVKATKTGNILSGRYYVGTTPTQIENGNIVKLNSLISGEDNLWKVVAAGAITAGNLYVVATPEVIYDEGLTSDGALDKFINPAGANITLVPLEVGDEIDITDECITAIDDDDDIPAVGNLVEVSATGTKWLETATLTSTVVFYGKIINRKLYKNGKYTNVVQMQSVR